MQHPNPDSSSTGLDPKVAALLCYLAGFVTGIIFLVLEKQSRYVKMHAMQSTVIFAGLLIINIVLGFIPFVGWIIGLLLPLVTFVLWIGLMVLALQGKIYKLPLIGDFCEKQISRF